jgi:hypothetical protein
MTIVGVLLLVAASAATAVAQPPPAPVLDDATRAELARLRD